MNRCSKRFVAMIGGLLTLALLMAVGCRGAGQVDLMSRSQAPADFQLQLHIQGADDPGTAQADRQTSQSLLLNDRTLRVAVGPGATADYYPGVTRGLEPSEVDQLWQCLKEENLLTASDACAASQPSVESPATDRVQYRLEILLGDRTIRISASRGENPGLDRLVRKLIGLRTR